MIQCHTETAASYALRASLFYQWQEMHLSQGAPAAPSSPFPTHPPAQDSCSGHGTLASMCTAVGCGAIIGSFFLLQIDDTGVLLPIIESQNHKMAWVGRDLKDQQVPTPCRRQGHHTPHLTPTPQPPKVPSSLALNISRGRAFTASLGSYDSV